LAVAGRRLVNAREANDGDRLVRADLAPVDLPHEAEGLVDPAKLGVVVLDVAWGKVGGPLDLDVVDDRGEQLLAWAVLVADGHPRELAALVLARLVAEPDRRGLAATAQLIGERRREEVESVKAVGHHASAASLPAESGASALGEPLFTDEWD